MGIKKRNILLTLLAGVGAAALVLIVTFSIMGFDALPDFFGKLLRTAEEDNGRFGLWKSGLGDYVSAPVFGTGFAHGADVQPYYNVFSRFYHNMIVQLLGATGTVGILAFIVHMKGVFELCLRKFRVGRLLIGMGTASSDYDDGDFMITNLDESKYSANFDLRDDGLYLKLDVIPEPAAVCSIFGVVALALAAHGRRKK